MPRLIQIAGILGVDVSVMLPEKPGINSPLITALQNELNQTKEELKKANQQIENLRGEE